MAGRRKKVIWTKQGYSTLDEAVAYVAQDSLTAAQQLLESALDMASSLTVFDERGRIVPELEQPSVRELLIQRYRLIYEVFDTKVEILAFMVPETSRNGGSPCPVKLANKRLERTAEKRGRSTAGR
jgi:toxin ParE1/3/4